jgi:hypothetical protein
LCPLCCRYLLKRKEWVAIAELGGAPDDYLFTLT